MILLISEDVIELKEEAEGEFTCLEADNPSSTECLRSQKLSQ